MKIGIISDSSTGFTTEEIEKYDALTIVPLVIIDAQGNIYQDNNKEINTDELFLKMISEHNHLKTSQTNPTILKTYWDKALQKYDQILFLPIGQKASGQYQTAKLLQKSAEFKNKVHVFETGAASVPLKFMSLIALKLANQNKNMTEIISVLNNFRKNYEFFLAPNDLRFLSRGGRLPSGIATLGNLLRLKPILKCKEDIKKVDQVRTLNGAMNKMLDLIMKVKDATKETIYIIDGWCDKKIIDKAIEKVLYLGFTKYKIEKLCNILKTHTGNNTIGFSIVPNELINPV